VRVPGDTAMRQRFMTAVVLSLLALVVGCTEPKEPEPFPEPIAIEIKRGTTSQQIAEELEAKGVISSKWRFLLIRAWRRGETLQAGYYRFDHPMSEADAYQALKEGSVRYYPVTIPEGFTRLEIAKTMAATGKVDQKEFLDLTAKPDRIKEGFPEAETLEGFLFPDTYYLDGSSTAEKVVSMMLERFHKVYAEATKGATSPLKPFELVVLASMIERETPESDEHRVVSSVFHNRLRLGMLMQCDSTVTYGLELENRYRGRLLEEDLKDPHRFNTYIHPGLPPGPIANPGERALAAAAKPDTTDYLYFVAKGNEKGHVFSETLVAHNRAVQAYRRSLGR